MTPDSNTSFDAIVIGAGAGGGVAAKELSRAGLKTLLIERGDWPDYEDSTNDEFINQRSHIIRPLNGPDRRKSPRAVRTKDGWKAAPAYMPDYSVVAACVGSGTVTYGAMAWRFMPQDFRLKSTYGDFEGSSIADWPISYADLEPFYEKAEWEIGVSGNQRDNPFAPPRKKDFPMPPFEHNDEDIFLMKTCRRLGLHPYPIPMLRNSVPYNGRAACIRNRTCCGYVCPVDAKNGTQNTVIPTALKSGNCKLLTNCVAAEIVMEGGRATGVRYFDADKKIHFARGDIIVASMGACETARLFWNSKSGRFPDGIGNQNDQLGRHLQSHAYTGAYGLFDDEVVSLKGPGATFAISDFNHNPRENIIGGVLCSEFYRLPYALSNLRPPNAPKWGAEHKKFQRENSRKILQLLGPVQEIPTPSARVIVRESVRDYWGLPVYGFEGFSHPDDWKHCDFLSSKAEMILKESGAKTTWRNLGARGVHGKGGGQHQAGTCRMGENPKTSVTDPFCKVWGTDNLFVADGSPHVTNGGFNPVLTIMALSYRTSENIVKTFGRLGA